MLSLKDIIAATDKLGKREENSEKIDGEIIFTDNRGKENRITYFYKREKVFTCGISRGSKKRAKSYWYVPEQMGLTNKEFRALSECPMSKREYNEKMIKEGKISGP